MGDSFKNVLIGDVCSVGDGAHSKVKRIDEGVPYLTSKNIGRGILKLDKLDFISEESFEKLFPSNSKATRRPQSGDVLIGIIGTFGNNYLYKDNDHFGFSSSIGVLRPDIKKLDSKYLYYAVNSKVFKANHANYNSGSVQGYTNISTVKSLPIPLPPLSVQKKIAKVLEPLDDKIELNRKTNETLEAMAQALFKSWFVDFDPVIDNALAEGNDIPEPLKARAATRQEFLAKNKSQKTLPDDIRKLFPNEFEFTEEMGWVPKGWEAGTLSDVTFVKGGYAFKGKDFSETGLPVIKIKNINKDKTVNTMDVNYIPLDVATNAKDFLLKSGDLIMAMTGATVGKFGLIMSGANEVFLLNQRVAKFTPLSNVSNKMWFIYCYLNKVTTLEYIENIAEGSAQPNISADGIMSVEIVSPTSDLVKKFDDIVNSNFLKIIENSRENNSLSELRDTLLPKLLSGELRIPDAEKLIENIA